MRLVFTQVQNESLWGVKRLTRLEPQSRFGGNPVKFLVLGPQIGTAVLKGLT